MVKLDLSADDVSVLRSVLESYLSDLRMEIADTDRLEFREMLKERKDVITRVIDALPGTG